MFKKGSTIQIVLTFRDGSKDSLWGPVHVWAYCDSTLNTLQLRVLPGANPASSAQNSDLFQRGGDSPTWGSANELETYLKGVLDDCNPDFHSSGLGTRTTGFFARWKIF